MVPVRIIRRSKVTERYLSELSRGIFLCRDGASDMS